MVQIKNIEIMDKQAKKLQKKIAKEFNLFDKWMKKLVKKNGVTKY